MGFEYGFGILTHSYLVVDLAPAEIRGQDGLLDIEQSLRNNPTPGVDMAASGDGQLNNVGTLRPVTGRVRNYVKSFFVDSSDKMRSGSIVNYTVKGRHEMDEGFVLRFAQVRSDGRVALVTYGEGNAFLQGNWNSSSWRGLVQRTWTNNAREIFTSSVHSRR